MPWETWGRLAWSSPTKPTIWPLWLDSRVKLTSIHPRILLAYSSYRQRERERERRELTFEKQMSSKAVSGEYEKTLFDLRRGGSIRRGIWSTSVTWADQIIPSGEPRQTQRWWEYTEKGRYTKVTHVRELQRKWGRLIDKLLSPHPRNSSSCCYNQNIAFNSSWWHYSDSAIWYVT